MSALPASAETTKISAGRPLVRTKDHDKRRNKQLRRMSRETDRKKQPEARVRFWLLGPFHFEGYFRVYAIAGDAVVFHRRGELLHVD